MNILELDQIYIDTIILIQTYLSIKDDKYFIFILDK